MRRRISPTPLVTTVIVISIVVGLSRLIAGSASGAAEGAASVPSQQRSRAAAERVGTSQVTSPITRIELRLKTGNRADAGTDGDVFLGIGGREFFVDSRSDDFERGSDRTYIFGVGATVVRPAENDPRSPWQLTFNELRFAPPYIRFEPGSDWNVELVETSVTYTGGNLNLSRLAGGAHLWLGEKRGKFIYLR